MTPYTVESVMELVKDCEIDYEKRINAESGLRTLAASEHAASRRQLYAAIESLVSARDDEEKRHFETINDRDYFANRLTEIHVALGGDGEWSSDCDVAAEAVDLVTEIIAERDALKVENAELKKALNSVVERHTSS